MASSASQARIPTRQRTPQQSSFGSFNPRAARITTKAKAHSDQTDPMELPDRFKYEEDDEEDDGTGVGGDDVPFIQQSVYGMLAATQSRANFPSRFQQESGSDSEDDDNRRKATGDRGAQSSLSAQRNPQGSGSSATQSKRGDARDHRKRLSEPSAKLARSFLKPARGRPDSQTQDLMTQSQILAPPSRHQTMTTTPETLRSDAPILDRRLKAMARIAKESSALDPLSARTSREVSRTSSDSLREKASKSLSQVVTGMFKLDEVEEVKAEYPCWYLQNVLLQGFMYITEKHICFYSYLQKKSNSTTKSGHLSKQGKRSYRYSRYWFVLKGHTFSYYENAAEPYSPLAVIDLRYAISADITKPKEASEEATDFTITTPMRTFYYRGETAASARDWVKHLQKVIFRSHNESDSVKISLPIENVLDIEQTSVVDFAENFKFRVIADDETFAVDEYFFAFFNTGDNALHILKSLSNASGSLFRAEVRLSDENEDDEGEPEVSQQAASEQGRRGVEAAKARGSFESQSRPTVHESTDSLTTNSELANSSSTEDMPYDDMSASQMLTGDSVFRGPTLRTPGNTVDRLRSESGQSSRDSSGDRAVHQSYTPQALDRTKGHSSTGAHDKKMEAARRTAGKHDTALQQTNTTVPGRLVRGISTPLLHAKSVAGIVKTSGQRMGSYLSSSPKTYIDNWSAAIVGGKRHYTGVEGLDPDDSIREPEQDMDVAEHERRFQEHFGLPKSEKLLSVFYCWLHKTVPLYGKIYMGTREFCFRSLWYGTKTKLVIPFKDIINVQKQRGFRWGYPGMVLVIRGYEELFFDFPSIDLRDEAVVTVLRSLETLEPAAQSTMLTEEEQQNAADAAAENELLEAARKDEIADHDIQLPRNVHQIAPETAPILFDDPSASVLDFRPSKPLRITCLTIGSRGDVQPYIALCKGLQAEGHTCRIATHLEFKDWVERHGIEFAAVNGDPAELMRVCVENGMFTPSFFLEVNSTFRGWLDELLSTAWDACQGSDLLIESPSAMCGIHIAEALEIPYFRAFTMPWTRTRAYPHAFAVPTTKRGGGYNYMTYTFFDNIFWTAIAGQINRWRGKTLGLSSTSLDKLQQNKVPFLYNFSPNVVVPPLDFSDWIKITGYWFLDEGDDWEPPKELAAFLKKARDDKQKLVYIGFGSVTVSDSRQLMQQVVDAVVKADVRCILAKGWSDRYDKQDPAAVPIELPSCIHQIRSAPHDWLFKQVDAVVHHGGAGTTGASLRAGKPTIIKPFFGDQYFFATRVEDLGVGQYLKKVTAHQLGKALWVATHDARMCAKAAALGESIRAEDGVKTAINAIYRDLDYAKTLIKKRGQKVAAVDGLEANMLSESEEAWTFIEKDHDADPMAAAS